MNHRQVDRLLSNMRSVFAHLAEIDPFLRETRSLLKNVASGVEGWEAASPDEENNKNHALGDPSASEEHHSFVETGGPSGGYSRVVGGG